MTEHQQLPHLIVLQKMWFISLIFKAFRIFCIQNDVGMAERLRAYIRQDLDSAQLLDEAVPIPSSKEKRQRTKDLENWLESEWGDPTTQRANGYRWEDTV